MRDAGDELVGCEMECPLRTGLRASVAVEGPEEGMLCGDGGLQSEVWSHTIPPHCLPEFGGDRFRGEDLGGVWLGVPAGGTWDMLVWQLSGVCVCVCVYVFLKGEEPSKTQDAGRLVGSVAP